MSVFNRRNAMIGWAAWTVAKQVAKRKARQGLHADESGKRRFAMPAFLVVAAATVAGVLLFWRRRARPAGIDEYAQ